MGWLVSFALAAVALAAAAAYMTLMPGASHGRELPPLTQEERELSARLRAHVAELARGERNLQKPEALERAARYIEDAFAAYGHRPQSHGFTSAGALVRNIEVAIPPDAPADARVLVIGAHYDSVFGSPGADDNASGVAALLELGRLLVAERPPAGRAIRLVAFVNEEPPYFMSEQMGSAAWARRARARGEEVSAMISLEMLGCFDDSPGSQAYPPPLGLFYPPRGDFIAFVGDLGSRALVRRAIGAFRRHATIPSEGVSAPSAIPGILWSDHWSFREHGYPAIMVTDTSFFRYPHYHLYTDTPEKLDYDRMARVTAGLAKMAPEMAR